MFTTSQEVSKRDIHKAHQQAVEDYYTAKATGLPNDRQYTREDFDFIAALYENKVPLDAAIKSFVERKSRKNPTSALKRSKTREEIVTFTLMHKCYCKRMHSEQCIQLFHTYK